MSILDQQIYAPTQPINIKDGSQEASMVAFDVQFNSIINTRAAKKFFNVDGKGLTAAVLDTGLNSDHECFRNRILNGVNFSSEGVSEDTQDRHGHGTNVAGLIAAKGTMAIDPREGIATGAKILPIKVLPGTFSSVINGLEWILEHPEHNISIANLSLGFPGTNYIDDQFTENDQSASRLKTAIQKLSARNIAVVIAAGNDYFEFQSEGMSFPAIIKECISVGAVYDDSVGARAYASGAKANSTHSDQITPFSQRLSEELNRTYYTTVFAPGAAATSTGIGSDTATSTQDGTSQATPTVAGVILLLQEFVLRQSGTLPTVEFIKNCLRAGAVNLIDGDDEDDNVKNTNRRFPRIDAFATLRTAQSGLTLKAIS